MTQLIGRVILKSNKKKYITLNRNQLLILDSLLTDGSIKQYIDTDNNTRYSEHSGYLNITTTNNIDRFIISTRTNREDKDDSDILLPYDLYDSYEYKYIFHTHPKTPTLGRFKDNILYEFPSVDDLFHFIDHYNMGKTIGSIIIAPEGYYIIYPNNLEIKEIIYDIDIEDDIINKLNDGLYDIELKAIEKYGTKYTEDFFYSVIAYDKHYLNLYNKLINKYLDNQIKIIIVNRTKDIITNKWLVKKLTLPI